MKMFFLKSTTYVYGYNFNILFANTLKVAKFFENKRISWLYNNSSFFYIMG